MVKGGQDSLLGTVIYLCAYKLKLFLDFRRSLSLPSDRDGENPRKVRLEWDVLRGSEWERNRGLEVLFQSNKGTKNDLCTTLPEDGLKIKSWFGCDGDRKYRIFL